jgi:murein DD-endopeptidase MepM/ murein hydrolase activator NlpD
MSYKSGGYHPHPHSHQQHSPQIRPKATAMRRPSPSSDYVLGHAGRVVRLGPVAFWIVTGTLVIMGLWTIGTGTYFTFRDDVLTRLIGRQTDMQFAYEDRIAELRSQIDRITSRQMLDQEQFEQKLDSLVKRQAELENQSGAMGGLGDTTGSIKPTRANRRDPGKLKPSPINDLEAPRTQNLHSASAGAPMPLDAARPANGGKNIDAALAKVSASLDRVEQAHVASLDTMETKLTAKASILRKVFSDIGVNPTKLAPAAEAVGGPFVPARPRPNAAAFERQVYRISVARANAEYLSRALTTVPVRKPLEGELEQSSGFGVRVDPFVGAPAMHTGLDFRGQIGEAVHVTASGRVKSAGWSGGYGKMVEVDHGNGISTRYGHLSEIKVVAGQRVRLGQVVGLLGSTGRSTGPHLHYETRVDGEAVEPHRFLRAGAPLSDG